VLVVLGECGSAADAPAVVDRLADAEPRVVLRAALAAGRLAAPGAVEPLIAIVREQGAADPDLRHAAVMGLAGCACSEDLALMAADDSPQVRLAAALVWRRRADPALAGLLRDGDPLVVLEAARAIHDLPVPAALPALAALLPECGEAADTALLRRALNANYRLGLPEHGRALAEAAARDDLPPERRAEALELLAEWVAPEPTDRVTGAWAPLPERPGEFRAALAAELWAQGLGEAEDEVVLPWLDLVASAQASGVAPALAEWVLDAGRGSELRCASMEALGALPTPDARAVLDAALADPDAELRATALAVLEALSPEEALPRVPEVLEQGDLPEQRVALRILSHSAEPSARELLAGQLGRLPLGLVPAELQLDLVLAAEECSDPALDAALARHREARAADAELSPWLDGLFGGDAKEGEEVFRRASLSCQRCHATFTGGPKTVGPSLAGVGGRLSRLQLLEAIVLPNRRTAKGFAGTTLFLRDGSALSGRVLGEADGCLRVQPAEGG
ncbi:MAG TPA: hypothetical protein VFD43_11935, partial [Planctomycetota bacterium]|nr:hypothetical protein [Planctomycetota bacterium]